MRRNTSLLLIALLMLSLAHCGQKGGLTRPEQATFSVASK
ncbi:MAG: lipoprotein [Gammaproteobacteria bacterium]|nr:lipoprotein [Gammaproteobacteria bacterium]